MEQFLPHSIAEDTSYESGLLGDVKAGFPSPAEDIHEKLDMILYERYEDQVIKEGQVIIFLEQESKIVHRVVKIERIGNETRYYTKGDANEDLDYGYRVDSDIFGLTDIKIAYIGYPTLWLRELINN